MGIDSSSRYKKGENFFQDLEAEIIAHAWKEPDFKQKLLSNPREALLGLGFELPQDVQCKIIEEPSHTWTLVLPSCPKNAEQLDKEELKKLAITEAHPLHRIGSTREGEEGLWELFSHRFWPSHHEE